MKESPTTPERTARYLGAAFAGLMASNYLLQSVRDAQMEFVGKSIGSKMLTLSTIVSLGAAPCAKFVVRPDANDTAAAIRTLFRAFALLLLASCLLPMDKPATGAWQGTLVTDPVFLTSVLFVLSQAINNVIISITWSHASDLMPVAEYTKYFSAFGAASTAGQAVGSLLATVLLSSGLPVHLLGAIIAVMIEASAYFLVAATRVSEGFANRSDSASLTRPTRRRALSIRARAVTELIEIVKPFADSYVLLICAYTVLYTSTLSLIYLERVSAVADMKLGVSGAANVSAKLSLVAAGLTFAAQAFFSFPRPARWLTVDIGLFTLPVVTFSGFAVLYFFDARGGDHRLFLALAFELIRRVAAFAVAKPTRESLYASMPRESKFAVKSIIDTFVYRAGMALGAMLHGGASHAGIRNSSSLLMNFLQLGIAALWFIVAQQIRLSAIPQISKAYE